MTPRNVAGDVIANHGVRDAASEHDIEPPRGGGLPESVRWEIRFLVGDDISCTLPRVSATCSLASGMARGDSAPNRD